MSTVSLTPEMEALLRECMSQGDFRTPEEAILAGLNSLRSQRGSGDFHPGELDQILASTEARLAREGPVSIDKTRQTIREMSELRRKRA